MTWETYLKDQQPRYLDELLHFLHEFFRLSSFRRGPVAYGKLLHQLGEVRWRNESVFALC